MLSTGVWRHALQENLRDKIMPRIVLFIIFLFIFILFF